MSEPDPKIIARMEQQIGLNPDSRGVCDQLVQYLNQFKKWSQASACYQRYLQRQPNDAEGHFNFAYQLKLEQKFEQSIEQYKRAFELGISQPEEVFLNIALIYSDFLRDNDNARKSLNQALQLNPAYVSAIYNLANLEEDAGNRKAALALFKKVLELSPGAVDCDARILQLQDNQDEANGHIIKLKKFVLTPPNRNNVQSHISARYALGKAFDDLKLYDEAANWYQQANELNQYILPSYDRVAIENWFAQIKQSFNQEFFDKFGQNNLSQPIFICGMFRSGSTLTEQILAGHSRITAGGEREYLLRQIKTLLPKFPVGVELLTGVGLKRLGEGYLHDLLVAFPDADLITDKRPDNFLYIGLILAMYPKAKIIISRRNALDNCLSNYFLQLGPAYHYAANIGNCLHYYQQQQSLIEHWLTLFPDNIHFIDYEKLTETPEQEVTDVMDFLDLQYEPDCLNFHTLDNTVKTASVWQVRKPLYKSSSGRWKNYQAWLERNLDKETLSRFSGE